MIDETSLKILRILQEKARVPNVEVARKMEMAPSAVLERIRKMERQGIIDGYEVRLNPERFNKRQIAFVRVYMEASESGSGDLFASVPEVQEVHFITGDDCYLLKMRVADNEELATILKEEIRKIKGVLSISTATVLHTYKETAKLPLSTL